MHTRDNDRFAPDALAIHRFRTFIIHRVVPSGAMVLGACQAPVDSAPNGSRTTHGALIVAESPACSVSVDQISYDDPGADDAELIQLVVGGASADHDDGAGQGNAGRTSDAEPGGGGGGAPGGPLGGGGAGGLIATDSAACGSAGGGTHTSAADAGDPAAGGAGSAPLGRTLGDCGLESLELLNGGVDGCPVYRSIDLTGTPVPEDGYVVLCSEDSSVAGGSGCDVTHAGTRKLPNGWLQNGPADALRFVATDGRVTELGYEGTNSDCLLSDPVGLHDETGEATDGSDDVNVACGDTFQLMSALDAPLRTSGLCGGLPSGPESSPEAGTGEPLGAQDGGTKPATEATYGSVTGETVTETSAPLLPAPEAGTDEMLAMELVQAPPDVSCRLAAPGQTRANPRWPGLAALALLGLLGLRKTTASLRGPRGS